MVLRFEPDVECARWFSDDDSHWARLCSIGPSGFDRYLQVLHPMVDGQTEPAEGDLDDTALLPLLGVLERHTSTPQDCFFALWDGYGDVHGGSAVFVPPSGAHAGGIAGSSQHSSPTRPPSPRR